VAPKRKASRRVASTPHDARATEPARQAGGLFRSAGVQLPILALALVSAGVWAYSTSFGGVLVLDDVRAIARNATIRTLWPLSIPLSPPTASTVAGRPVANLSFALSYALAPSDVRDVYLPTSPGTRPDAAAAAARNLWGYHAGNLLIHVAAGLALFGVGRRTLASERLRPTFGAAATWLAWAIALLWLVHPLQTSAVTYLVQRVESLMGLFYLLTLYCAIRASEGVRARVWTAAAVTFCALGMGTKEVMVTAPLIVWIWRRLFLLKLDVRVGRWLVGGLAATWLLLGWLLLGEQRGPSIALIADMVWSYLLTQFQVITHYVRLAIVPSPLVFLYDWPLVRSLATVAGPAALLVLLVVATAVGVARRHPTAFLGAWFFLILAPSSSLLPIVTEVAAEHRMYLPLAAVIGGVVIGVFLLARVARARIGATPDARSWPLAALGLFATVALAAAYGSTTRARSLDYGSAERLWADAVAKRPSSPRARVAYAETLANLGRLPEAEAQLRTAVDQNSEDPVAQVRLGSILAAQSRLEEAIGPMERALALDPNQVDASRLLGIAYALAGQPPRAVAHLERALAAGPDDLEVLTRLAAILSDPGNGMLSDPTRAVALAERAVRLTRRQDPLTLNVLGLAIAVNGRPDQAASIAEEALALARAQGNEPLARELEFRVAAYRSMTGPGPRR
jgi:tetratricopeptide (TPR) repeat protein